MGLRAALGTRGGARRGWLRGAAALLAAGSLASALTACGSEDKPVRLSGGTFTERLPADRARGEQLATEGMDLLRSADSLRINVEMSAGSAATGSDRHQEVTLHLDRRSNCTGTFDSGPGQRGDLIMIAGGAAYVRFTDESLATIRDMAEARGPAVLARVEERIALVKGKYLKVPAGDGSSGRPVMPGARCDLDELLGKLDDAGDDGFDGQIQARPATYRYGKHVIPLVEPKADGALETNAMYVAAEGKPYITAFAMEEDGKRMTMRMSDYGRPVEAHAPPAAQTVDASELGGGPAGADLFEV
ncbi:lipoprotein [Streptomyces aureoverticillatus]|nr:lipoprotein [Streptomyces aureoverticillatus]